MNKKVSAIENHEGLCWKCLSSLDKSEIHIIEIPELGYNSAFDGEGTRIQLCQCCYKKSKEDNPNIWNMEVKQLKQNGYFIGTEYLYEADILDFIDKLPIQSQQFVLNEFANGSLSNPKYKMKPQDWIDYNLGILSHEKCKEYGMYSFDEMLAYDENFPTCQNVVNIIYDDDSKGSKCPCGAYGGYNQTTDNYICEGCYGCKSYKKRTNPITTMTIEEFRQKYEQQVIECMTL